MQQRRYSVAILFIFTGITLFAQINTYSPYTRFGLGDLSKNGLSQNLAMGGTGLAIHEDNRVNILNPAASSSLDSTSVYFDFGANAYFNQYSYQNPTNPDGNNLSNSWSNGNFHHLVFGSTMGKHMGLMAGIVPYSSIGYNIKQEYNDYTSGTAVDTYYRGDGGIMNFFLGTSAKFLDRISVGLTMNYLMGKLSRERYVNFPMNPSQYSRTSSSEEFDLRQIVIGTGFQYKEVFNDKFFISLGGVYDFKANANAELDYKITNSIYGDATTEDILLSDSSGYIKPNFPIVSDTIDRSFVIPQKFGLGFSFGIPDKLTVTGDYYIQDWTGSMEGPNYKTTKASSMHFGAEYTPDRESIRGYHKLVTYRVGAFYSNSYLSVYKPTATSTNIDDFYQLNDYGITFGVGLPVRTLKSSLNVAFTLGTRGTTEYNLVKENYGIITFNVTLHDLWFRKRRYD